jgi:hypothetical protein
LRLREVQAAAVMVVLRQLRARTVWVAVVVAVWE